MSKVKPILFNTEMVRAILDGRKTVTRRVVKPRYKGNDYGWRIIRNSFSNKIICAEYYDEFEEFTRIMDPPYQPEDVLYVRETFARVGNKKAGRPMHYEYRASCKNPNYFSDGFMAEWRPSIHMPKEAARIWLKVTGVGVERLQDITEEQAEKEGGINNIGFIHSPDNEYDRLHTAKEDFRDNIWDFTIKKSDLDRYGWEANPFVWVIVFERCEKPESEV